MKIKSKQQIIEHFISGNKPDQFIGVENEKFLFKGDYKALEIVLELMGSCNATFL